MMTKKDFELIASVLQGIADADERHATAERFADALYLQNDRFDTLRFLRACEPGANVRARTR